ncbi:unnamed protein product, partial [Rotaria sp. Silwood2]
MVMSMWRSVVTCVPVQIKPISKRSQYAIEDLQALQQEQLFQDSTGYNRQVLPNIRPIPKSKSSIPQKQTTVVEMPILTKYVNRP